MFFNKHANTVCIFYAVNVTALNPHLRHHYSMSNFQNISGVTCMCERGFRWIYSGIICGAGVAEGCMLDYYHSTIGCIKGWVNMSTQSCLCTGGSAIKPVYSHFLTKRVKRDMLTPFDWRLVLFECLFLEMATVCLGIYISTLNTFYL